MAEIREEPSIGAFRVGGWLCEPTLNRIGREGRTLQLEPKIMLVLVRLAESPGRVVSRQELLDTVWPGTAVSEQVLSRAISELRKAFDDDPREPRTIETIAKRGYRLIATTEPVEPSTEPTRPVASVADLSPRAGRPTSGRWFYLLAGALLGVAAVWTVNGLRSRTPAPRTVPRASLSLILPGDAPPAFDSYRSFVVSPDGNTLVYTGDGLPPRLWLRHLDRDEVEPLVGGEGGYGPFFSADGSQIGFYAGGKMKRVPAEGGDAVTLLADASDPMGADWRADGTLVFVGRLLEGLRILRPDGQLGPLTTLDEVGGERAHLWPRFLPDGERLLFTVWRGGGVSSCSIELLDLASGARRRLIDGGADARYVNGRLLIASSGTLVSVPFDAGTGELGGPPETVMDDLLTHPITGAGHFAVTADGTLFYAPRSALDEARSLRRLRPDGEFEALPLPAGPYALPRLSPDGHRLALTFVDYALDVWLQDLDRPARERLTREGLNFWALWSPDGRAIAFSSDREGPFNLYYAEARADAPARRLTVSDNMQTPGSFDPTGGRLYYSEFDPDTRWDIWTVDLDDTANPQGLLVTRFDELRPTVSPDGRLLAYVSNESGEWSEDGRWEIYLRLLASTDTRVQVSADGGIDPVWSRDGRQLFYRHGHRLMRASLDRGSPPRVVSTEVVTDRFFVSDSGEGVPGYDRTADGAFIFVGHAGERRPTPINVDLGRFN